MRLVYIGKGNYIPGWPASDHEEPDRELAARKLSSGLYKKIEEYVSSPLPKRKKKEEVEEMVETNEEVAEVENKEEGGEEE